MTDTDRTDLRTKMLEDAAAHYALIVGELDTARADRDELRAQLAKITAEMNARDKALAVTIRGLVEQRDEADALVRSLTPRKPRSDRTATTTTLVPGATVSLGYDEDSDQ